MAPSETDETFESYGADIGETSGAVGRIREWVIVEGNRVLVAVLVSAAVFVLLLALHAVGIVSFNNPNSVTRVASGMIAGTFSLVTLVVSVNQLILSQEFTGAGMARERLEGVAEFRRAVADAAAVPASPATPTRILELLVASIRHDADAFADAVESHDGDREVARVVTQYANDVRKRTERIDEKLDNPDPGSFNAISAAINYDEAWHLYIATYLRGEYGDVLSPAAAEHLEELIDALELFGVAREQFKTTYLQRELTRFSQLTIYCGAPSIVAAIVIGLLYADITGASVNVAIMPYIVIGLTVVVLSPLSLLVSYILRTATITRRTASTGPMIHQKDPDAGPFDVRYGEERQR
ncbi:hypothetical protein [Halopiger thermotolerans]